MKKVCVKHLPIEEAISATVHDPMCYPQLNPKDEIFEPELSFAKKLRNHIEFTTDYLIDDAEDPTSITIY